MNIPMQIPGPLMVKQSHLVIKVGLFIEQKRILFYDAIFQHSQCIMIYIDLKVVHYIQKS